MNFEGAMRRRVVISSILGNALEWFDFTVFGLFVGVLSRLFFPDSDASNSLLKMFATFGVAFAARPLGGIAFGLYADRHGRKQAMVVMITMMAIGTGLIGLLPTYASIGILAPIMILLARIIQGISAGGVRQRQRHADRVCSAWFTRALRKLPDRLAGSGFCPGRQLGLLAQHWSHSSSLRKLGLASALFVGDADRSRRLLYTPSR